MRCPHCRIAFSPNFNNVQVVRVNGWWYTSTCKCPECKKVIIRLVTETGQTMMVYPKGSSRPPCPLEVPNEIAEDYNEACLVLPDSPKASAALSRRCLQNIIRQETTVKHQDLSKEIQDVLDNNILPSYLSEGLDAVRNIGNFAAHPIKSKHTGEVMDVEPGEAEWNMEILEGLFDFFYVQPEILRKKKEALNIKLSEAGKPPMK